jgi:hypothetical protein
MITVMTGLIKKLVLLITKAKRVADIFIQNFAECRKKDHPKSKIDTKKEAKNFSQGPPKGNKGP